MLNMIRTLYREIAFNTCVTFKGSFKITGSSLECVLPWRKEEFYIKPVGYYQYKSSLLRVVGEQVQEGLKAIAINRPSVRKWE